MKGRLRRWRRWGRHIGDFTNSSSSYYYYYYQLHLFHNSYIAAQRFGSSSCRWSRATAKQRRHGTVRTVDLTVLVEKRQPLVTCFNPIASDITLYGRVVW